MPRADAQRNLDALLAAADEEFAAHGVEVGVRAIAARAGVGTATLYRHFPLRSDLITAVFRREVDACAARAESLARRNDPVDALEKWIWYYAHFIATKRGLAAALHSGDPTLAALPGYFQQRLGPALQALLDSAADARVVRRDVDPIDLLSAVAKLCVPPTGAEHRLRGDRMIALLLDGLRYRADAASSSRTPGARPRQDSNLQPRT